MFIRSAQPRIVRLVAMAMSILLIAGCASGAPSVNQPPTSAPSSGNAIEAPSGAVIPVSTGTPTVEPAAGTVEPAQNDAGSGVAALQTSQEEPTPEPTPTEKPPNTPTPEPTATERPAAPEPSDPDLSEVYESGSGERDEVALTFDAGDDRGYAEEILDILEEYGVTATFGITGHWASENPDLVERIVKDGHQVINHTWSHYSLTGFSTGEGTGITTTEGRTEELESTNDEILDISGYDTRPYFRPPYGDLDESVLADMAALGYTVTVMWSCDTLGWDGLTADEINARCTDTAEAGAIILMHVGEASQDAAALPAMIEQLQERGFELVSIEQLLQP